MGTLEFNALVFVLRDSGVDNVYGSNNQGSDSGLWWMTEDVTRSVRKPLIISGRVNKLFGKLALESNSIRVDVYPFLKSTHREQNLPNLTED